MLGAGPYWWLVIPGFALQCAGLLQALRHRALGGQSIYPEDRAARSRGQMIFVLGAIMFLVGRLLGR